MHVSGIFPSYFYNLYHLYQNGIYYAANLHQNSIWSVSKIQIFERIRVKEQYKSIHFFLFKNKQTISTFGNDLELEFKENKINEEDHEDTKPDSWKMLTFWNWKN